MTGGGPAGEATRSVTNRTWKPRPAIRRSGCGYAAQRRGSRCRGGGLLLRNTDLTVPQCELMRDRIFLSFSFLWPTISHSCSTGRIHFHSQEHPHAQHRTYQGRADQDSTQADGVEEGRPDTGTGAEHKGGSVEDLAYMASWAAKIAYLVGIALSLEKSARSSRWSA